MNLNLAHSVGLKQHMAQQRKLAMRCMVNYRRDIRFIARNDTLKFMCQPLMGHQKKKQFQNGMKDFKMSDKWKRFEQGPKGTNSHIPARTKSGADWVVLWDHDPKFYFASYPNSWGGSGWYADPQDVIVKPEAN